MGLFIQYFSALFELLLFVIYKCYTVSKTVNAELRGRQALLGQSCCVASFVSSFLGCDPLRKPLVRLRGVSETSAGLSLPKPSKSAEIGSKKIKRLALELRNGRRKFSYPYEKEKTLTVYHAQNNPS